MSKMLRVAAALTVFAGLTALPAVAQDAEEDAPVTIVTVNGTEITQRDLALAAETYVAQIQRVPAQLRLPWLVDRLIDQTLLAEVGKSGGVESTEAYQHRIDYFTRQSLRDAYIESIVAESISETEIQARYDEEVAKLPEEEEAVARHILVETEDEAKEVAEAARGGADFAELAKEKSTGPSAADGGALDPFTADEMVPEFSQAAFAMEPGTISEPVKSQFGWHVIKLEEKRAKAPPSLDEIRENVRVLIMRDRVQAEIKKLREDATIEYAQGAEPDAAPAGPAEDAAPTDSAQ